MRFSVADRTALRGRLVVETALGSPDISARLEVTARPLWLPTERRVPVSMPVHAGYEFALDALAVPAVEEAIAEKLAAWRRRRKMRDLYDLYWFGQGTLDETLIRRLVLLKVWHDVVDDGLGRAPFRPDEITQELDASRLTSEEIGLLTQPVEPARWLGSVRTRYRFVEDFDVVDAGIARCDPRDRREVTELSAALGSS